MIDIYCERLGPGLWAEPVNAMTNVAFLLAAWGAWRLATERRALFADISVLIALIVAVGIGSGLFHTLATFWARMLDVGSILLFQLAFLWVYIRRTIGIGRMTSAVMVVVYLAIALWSRRFPEILNQSLSYAPAIAILIVLGAYHWLARREHGTLILSAALIFFVSFSFRTIDSAACPRFALGTHFIWHLLNALVLYLLMKALLANVSRANVRKTLKKDPT